MNSLNQAMKNVEWVGDSRERLRSFPKAARRVIGEALQAALKLALKHIGAKPLRGVGAGVLEIIARYDRNTYRAVYTVKLGDTIYVLHAFQKKSTRGIRTPKREIDLVKQRLKMVREMEAKNE